jgi:hypothetical protein
MLRLDVSCFSNGFWSDEITRFPPFELAQTVVECGVVCVG